MQWKVIKIGGSILVRSSAEGFRFEYAQKLKFALDEFKEYNFSLTSGGGKNTREYMNQAKAQFPTASTEDINRVGVSVSNTNSEFLHIVFKDRAFERVLRYKEFDEFVAGSSIPSIENCKYIIASSSKAGSSNDYNALLMALRLKSKEVIVLKNIQGVFTSDPNKDKSASLIPKLSWSEYFDVIGNPKEFTPGSNYPVDIIAAREAQKAKVRFLLLDGENLENLKKALENEEFIGTYIS